MTVIKLSSPIDVARKAKRLLDEGAVTILRNGSQYVVANVRGDHGNYEVELQRQDPSSMALTGMSCSCSAGQYQWGRTRQFKKMEGKPCSHQLATFWASLKTPLDDVDPNAPNTPGQKQGPPMPSGDVSPGEGVKPPPGGPAGSGSRPVEQPIGVREQAPFPPGAANPTQRSFSPDEPSPQPSGPPAGPPQPSSPGIIPPNPMAQMQQWQQWQGPGTTDGGQESPPWAVSVPGVAQANPFRPIVTPGTYSSTKFNNGDKVTLNEDEFGTNDNGTYRKIPAGTEGEVFSTSGKFVETSFDLDNGEFITTFLEPSQLTKL